MTNRTFSVRLSVENEAAFKQALSDAGLAGQVSMKKLKDEVERVPAGLRAVDAAAGDLRGSLEEFASTSGPVGRIAAVLGPGGLVIAAGVAGLALLTRAAEAATAKIADIGDAAERAGFDAGTYEAISASLLLVGQSAEGLEQSLAQFSRTIGRALQGADGAEKKFAQLGVAIRYANGDVRPTAAIMADVADAIAEIENPAQRAAVANDLFGEASRRLLPLLTQGSEGMAKLRGEAEKLGLLYGGELIEKSGALNIEFERQARVIETQLNKAYADFAPTALWLKQIYADLVTGALNLTQALLGNAYAMEQINAQRREGARQQAEALRAEIAAEEQSLRAQEERAAKTGGDRSATISEIKERIRLRQVELDALNATLRARPAPGRNLPPVTPLGTDINTNTNNPGGGRQKNDASSFAADIAKVNDQLEKYYLLKQANEGTLLTMQADGATKYDIEAYQQFLAAILPLQEKYGVNFENLTEAQRAALEVELARAREQLPLIAQEAKRNDLLEARVRWQNEATQAEARASEEFRSFLADQATGLGEMVAGLNEGSDALNRFLLNLLKVAAEGAIFGQGPLGGFFSNIFGGSLVGSLFSPFPTTGGGPITAFAQGGIVDRPTLFPMRGGTGMMGEAGKEAILPLTQLPGGRLGVAATGGGDSFTYAPVIHLGGSVSAEDISAVRLELARDRAAFESRAVTAIQGAKKRRVKGL